MATGTPIFTCNFHEKHYPPFSFAFSALTRNFQAQGDWAKRVDQSCNNDARLHTIGTGGANSVFILRPREIYYGLVKWIHWSQARISQYSDHVVRFPLAKPPS